MNPIYPVDPRIEVNRAHYYNSSRLRAYCCGCIHGDSNTSLVCFFWAVISFYFAVTAFLEQSPFYSHIDTVSLVVFGAVNLLFGLVTLTSMVIFIFKARLSRMNANMGVITMMDSRRTVFAITANALGVLIVTIVNFIMFIRNKSDFSNWCVGASVGYVEDQYYNVNNNTQLPDNVLSKASDIYNCERLYQDEVKWALLCLVIMIVVYIHWILIVAARKTYGFYYTQRRDDPINSIMANVPPSSKKMNRLNVFNNSKPSKSILKELLTHRQYESFISPEDSAIDEKLNLKNEPTNTDNTRVNNSNIIHFEDNIYKSKEEIQPPCTAHQKNNILGSPNSSSTVININN